MGVLEAKNRSKLFEKYKEENLMLGPPELVGNVLFLFFPFLKKVIYLIYLFLAAMGLHCCARAFSSCSELGLLFVVVHGFLIAVASLCCGAQAQ